MVQKNKLRGNSKELSDELLICMEIEGSPQKQLLTPTTPMT